MPIENPERKNKKKEKRDENLEKKTLSVKFQKPSIRISSTSRESSKLGK